jgi:hypothetical protein
MNKKFGFDWVPNQVCLVQPLVKLAIEETLLWEFNSLP